MGVLLFLAGPLKGTARALEPGPTTIGRDDTAGLPIADPALSRQHCVITTDASGVTVRDLQSLNGTFVNGLPITERLLGEHDRLRIGDSVCVFVNQPEEPAAPVPPSADLELPPDSTIYLRREDARYLQWGRSDRDTGVPRSARDLRALLDTVAAVHAVPDRDALYQRLLELTVNAIPADGAALLLADSQSPSPVAVAQLDTGAPFVVSETVARRVMGDGVALLSNGVQEVFGSAGSVVRCGIRSVLCAPLSAFGRPLGVLYLANRGNRTFDADDLQLLTGIAGIAGVALAQARHVTALEEETARLRHDLRLEHNMVGDSPAMRTVYDTIKRLAATSSTVLIRGESGTGKELAARAIHLNGGRARRPFIAISCAALTESLLESELFGHEKGAFTGAIAQKRGKLEMADGGTVFLDEIGELAPTLQIKLLRVLQEREFERVGGTRPIKVDIRLIAATNRDLEAAIRSGSFRADLYYRLNVVSLVMPALRDRPDDIPLLAQYFIEKFSIRCHSAVRRLAPDARASLARYKWPGNVRELENAIERAIVMGSTDRILREDLPETILESEGLDSAPVADDYHRALSDMKRELIMTTIDQAGGNFTEAAKVLRVHPNYLHRLVKNLGLRERLTLRRPPAAPSGRTPAV